MSFRDRVRSAMGWAIRALKWGSLPLRDPALAAFFGPVDTASGIAVNEYTAFNSSAVFAAVRLLSEAMGQLEAVVDRESQDGSHAMAKDHYLWRLLHDAPNPEMTPMSCWSTLMAHVLTWGNAYAEIVRDGAGRPAQVWPIPPNRVRPRRYWSNDAAKRKICYDIFPNIASPYALQALPLNNGQEMVTIPAEDFLHIPGLGFDGLLGYSVVTMARESIGLTLATEQFGAGFFGRGSRPSGVLTHPGKLKKTARENLRESWEKTYQGMTNAHRVALLEEGIKWEAMGIPPEDAQFLQTRKFQIAEIARWFNVPPHMLRDLERATFSNIEHQGMDFVTYSLRPWLVRFVQEIHRKCLREDELVAIVVKFLYEVLQRGDFKSRMDAYHIAINDGILNPNECRQSEGWNHRTDEMGDEYRRPMNVVPDEMPAEPPAPAPAEGAGQSAEGGAGGAANAPADDPAAIAAQAEQEKQQKEAEAKAAADAAAEEKKRKARKAKKARSRARKAALITAQRAIIFEALERMAGVEATAIRRAAKDPKKFLPAAEEFYRRFVNKLHAAMLPGLRAHLVLLGKDPSGVEAIALREASAHVERSRQELLTASECSAEALERTINSLAKRWEAERPRVLADKLITEEFSHVGATAAV